MKQPVIIYHCPNFTIERSILLNIVSTMKKRSLTSCDATFVELFFYDGESSDLVTNILILNASAHFILSSKSFDGSLIEN